MNTYTGEHYDGDYLVVGPSRRQRLVSLLVEHEGVWDYDKSYDEPASCTCGWEDDETPHAEHVADAILRAGVVSD